MIYSEPKIELASFKESNSKNGYIDFLIRGYGNLMPLSELLPMIENLGVDLLTAQSHQDGDEWEVEVRLVPKNKLLIDSKSVQDKFIETLISVSNEQINNDEFNKLVTAGEFDYKACVFFRSIAKYLGQIQLPFSSIYIASTLAEHPKISHLLFNLFETRFDPNYKNREKHLIKINNSLHAEIDNVISLDQDRIFRSLLEVINAIVRTNYFLPDIWLDLNRSLAFKFIPSSISFIPKPCPAFEIFVFSTIVEGVHLRGGKVARGGLRWSERMEDYRTEVLGLMKAQMVKNAVIVPTGAKGGFISKCKYGMATDFDSIKKAYSSYIKALLDVTDNLKNNEIIPPTHVIRHDADDPYLVVAADKGTATFSDMANKIAQSSGFWLGDAFASGGSQGYDHKKMGITARGAWESAKRLFKEVGHDVSEQPFSVVGIGDMAGDVFGNGMLLSEQICLIGAFNHKHIFVDPTPNPTTSYIERKRLFEQPGSNWSDYDQNAISMGGGVFSRTAKNIPVTQEMKIALGIPDDMESLSPNELIQKILTAPVDMIWNGGIGTYVRGIHEQNAQVGDKANDPVRITSNELRAKIVVEGGNLGLTQQARIEFAKLGGLINTDAVDNSAGVDCSDHEVNIKILLDMAIRAERIDESSRNEMLAEMTDEVASLVLRNNYLQSKMLSQSNRTAPLFISKHAQLFQLLEKEGSLDRELEGLPNDNEIETRITNNEGLTRPEISVLLAYAKSHLFEKLIETNIIDDDFIAEELYRYFPICLQNKFRDLIEIHPLRREILASQLTNQVINRMGPTFCLRLLEQTDVNVARWIQSYTIAREAMGIPQLIRQIDGIGFDSSNDYQMDLQLKIHNPVEKATHWLLSNADWNTTTEHLIAEYKVAIDVVSAYLGLSSDNELIQGIHALEDLYSSFDIAHLSFRNNKEIEFVTKIYFEFSEKFQINWLRNEINMLPAFDKWQQQIKIQLANELESINKSHINEIILENESHKMQNYLNISTNEYLELLNEVKSQNNRHLAMVAFLVKKLSLLNLSA